MRTSLAFVLAGLVACGGGAAEGPKSSAGGAAGAGGASSGKPNAAGDVSFEVPGIEIKGVVFEPTALGAPGMPLAEPKGQKAPLTGDKLDKQIQKQRETVAKTKDPVQREAQAALLATMLYHRSKEQGQDTQKLLADARQALRDSAGPALDKADEITLRMLGSYELLLDDLPAAEKAWGALVAKAPKDKDAPTNRAWWALTLLEQHKNADALAAIKDQPVSDKTPELAYVTAWAKWRTGDNAGAWQAIVAAVKGWKDMPGREALDKDIYLFAGRTGAPLNDAITQLDAVYGKNSQYQTRAMLGLQAYQFAGRWADGVAALDKAVEVSAGKVPPNDMPVIRYTQADYTVRLDNPEQVGKFAKQALEALPACGQKCSDKDKENIVESVYIMARLLHILYATAHDDRYFQPALDLYNQSTPLITMNDATRAEAIKDQDILLRTHKGMKADAGTYDKDAIGALLKRHNQEIQACYELGLGGNPKLAGNFAVNIEVNAQGQVMGASSEPKAGAEGMALVAGCAAERAKQWHLPKKVNGTGAGVARIKLAYAAAPLAPTPAAKK